MNLSFRENRLSSVGIAIPVLNGARELERLLPALLEEPGATEILVIDSESRDATAKVVNSFSRVQLHTIRRGEFNHGATRELARQLLQTDIVVLLTQDVIPERGFLARLVEPLLTGRAAVAYARQLPHDGADVFEAAPREFNYPAESNVRALSDTRQLGVYTFFCSDSCAAYSQAALDEIGGFQPTLTNEDYFAVAALLRAGNRVAYVAEARVKHSHRYTLRQEFERYFDTGYVRAEQPWVDALAGAAEVRGARFASFLLRKVWRTSPAWLPYAMLQTGIKWAGFRAGYWAQRWRLPARWCRAVSSQKYYWSSQHFRRTKEHGHAAIS